jgi:hypothetical protein
MTRTKGSVSKTTNKAGHMLLTPYCRGLIGFDERTPCWQYEGNRPGCGKDYLNGITQIVYLGASFEDAPIGDQLEETRKRITASLVSGRRQMHFANCKGHLHDQNFIQAITSTKFRARMLGSTTAESDLELPNEIEFSFSGNVGLTTREDITRRTRKVCLEYFCEDENSRTFKNADLHGWVKQNRHNILSAIHALVKSWLDAGAPKGKTPFTSFPKWSEVVGGIMTLHGLGDPCLPQTEGLLGGDRKVQAMRALFETAIEVDDGWWTKPQLFSHVTDLQCEDDRLDWFGDLQDERFGRKYKTAMGLALKEFANRELSGIRMAIDTTGANSSRH